jgi:hypothetical protein
MRSGRLVLLATLVLAVLTAGCRGGGDVEGVDPEALLESAAARMEQVESFHFRLDHQNGTTAIVLGLQMISAEGDVAGPERLRLDVRARAGPLNIDVGIVILPEASYITNPITGRWQQEAITVSQFFDPATGMTALMRSVSGARVTGREGVGGAETYVVEADVDSGDLTLFAADAQPGRTLRAKAWIGVDDPLVYRVEVTGATSDLEAPNLVRRLELSRFDQPVEITAPR